MSYREVTALRRAGRLEEAHAMAAYDLEREYSDWTVDAMFWVERDLCLRYLDNGETEKARETLKHLNQLIDVMRDEKGYAARALGSIKHKMDPDYSRVQRLTEMSKNGQEEEAFKGIHELRQGTSLPDSSHESQGWITYRYLKKCQQTLPTDQICSILTDYLSLHITHPSNLHSLMLGQSGKISEHHPDFNLLQFVEQWGVQNLQDEDFESSEWNGRNVEPRVSRLLQYCFKQGYSIEDVSRVFTANERINQEDVLEAFSRQRFFIMNEQQKVDVEVFLQSARRYFDAVEGHYIMNDYHSIILSLYLSKLPENSCDEIPSSIEKWGWGCFRPEDWDREKGDNGKVFPSLVEKVVKGYLSAVKRRAYLNVSENFEQLLRQAIDRYGNDEHERALAHILQARGDREAALAIYRRLLLTMNKYYVWKELAGLTDDKELKISALCKAVMLEPNEDYLGNVHLALANLLLENGHPYEARCELGKYNSTYIKNKWKVSPDFRDIAVKVLRATNDNTRPIPEDNTQFYLSHTGAAEAFVYADIAWTTMVLAKFFTLEIKGKRKKRATLIGVNGKSVVVNPNVLPDNGVLGHCYDLKLYADEGKEKVVLSRQSEEKSLASFPEFTGTVDNVNEAKRLFHIGNGRGKGMVVLYSQTEVRPHLHDKVRVRYIATKNKDGKPRNTILSLKIVGRDC